MCLSVSTLHLLQPPSLSALGGWLVCALLLSDFWLPDPEREESKVRVLIPQGSPGLTASLYQRQVNTAVSIGSFPFWAVKPRAGHCPLFTSLGVSCSHLWFPYTLPKPLYIASSWNPPWINLIWVCHLFPARTLIVPHIVTLFIWRGYYGEWPPLAWGQLERRTCPHHFNVTF